MKNTELLKKAINLHLSGKNIQAAKIYNDLLQIEPTNIIILNNYGSLLNGFGKYEEAKKLLIRALKIKPDYVDALNNFGISSKLSKNYIDAISIFKKLINLKPNFLNSYVNLGNCLQYVNNFEEALTIYDQALNINPNSIDALYNKGTCLYELNLHEKAIDTYKKVLKLNSNHIETKWNLAVIQLLNGNYTEGWKNHEIRKIREKSKKEYENLIKEKNWTGSEKLKNKTIFVQSEQGLGDYIQYSRYLPMLENLGAKIILNTPKSIDKIIRTLKINYSHVNDVKDLKFDYNCSLMSLPLAFKTNINNIPNKTPYLFTPEAEKNYWKKKLGSKSVKRIGLHWTGNEKNEYERFRRIELEKLRKLLVLPFEFHSLEIDYNKSDLSVMKKYKNLICHKNEILGFDKTAGLIESMDLIISIDSGVLHLCGALNKPTWLLLPFRPDFRWLLNREDSPWYPSMKLYRQTKKNDWDNVITKVEKDLINF